MCRLRLTLQLDSAVLPRGTAVPAGDRGRLAEPRRQLLLVEWIVLIDVEVPHFLLLGLARGERTQRRSAEKTHLDVPCETMEAQKPALAFDSVEGRIPFNCLAHIGHALVDERVEPAADVALPAWHGRDVGLHGGVAIGLGD